MNLETELKRLKGVIGTPEFKKQLVFLYENFKNDSDKITDFVEMALSESSQKDELEFDRLAIRTQIADKIELLPLSYIAKVYFNKSRHWLYQRINGNTVNGKPAGFTQEELNIFNQALKDISKQIGSINILY